MMRKAKIIFSVILAAALVWGLIGTNVAFEQTDLPTFEIGRYEGTKGSLLRVPITVKNNPGITAIKLKIAYDSARLELTAVTYGSGWGGTFQKPQKLTSPVPLTWYNGAENYDKGESTFATLTFRILDDSPGESQISISYDPENVFNIAEENIPFAVVNGKVVGKYPVKTAYMSSNKIRMQLISGLDAEAYALYAAVYDANGRQKSLYSIDPTRTSVTLTIEKTNTDTVAIYGLRRDGMIPVMPKMVYDRTVNKTSFVFCES